MQQPRTFVWCCLVWSTVEFTPPLTRPRRTILKSRRSDAGGADVLFEDVAIRRGPVELLTEVNWRVMPGERWALTGENGVGKSSLLSAAVGRLPTAEGSVAVRRNSRVGYFEQTAVAGSTLTIAEEVRSQMPQGMETHEMDSAAAKVLKGLGFSVASADRTLCSELSGGWQMRVALARLLLSEPEVCLMDEPSNHLDQAARKWLGGTLRDWQGTLILVSHDQLLLREAAANIAEVVGDLTPARGRTLELYKGFNYDTWLTERSQRAKRWVATYDKQLKEAQELERFVERFGAKASKAAQAKDRQKKLDRLRQEMVDPPSPAIRRLATVDVSESKTPEEPKRRWFSLPEAPRCGVVPLALRSATVGYDGKVIVRDTSFEIPRGARIAVRGPNGAGKSTLGKALAGLLPLTEGDRIVDDRLEVGYFTQDLALELDPEMTALEVAVGEASVSQTEARSVLGALGLGQDAALRKVEALSGGQKARVALASFALAPGKNLYIFDEPSNHMSADACEALLDALHRYTGTLVVISHDRSFLAKLQPTHVLTVTNGTAYLESRDLHDNDWAILGGAGDNEKQQRKQESTVKKRDAMKLVGKLERKITDRETKIAALDVRMVEAGADVATAQDLAKQKEKLQKDLDAIYAEYEAVEDAL